MEGNINHDASQYHAVITVKVIGLTRLKIRLKIVEILCWIMKKLCRNVEFEVKIQA